MASGTALIFSLVLVAWAIWMRALTGTWLHPGSFFALWWCFAGIVPMLLAPAELVGPNVILWLVVASIAVSAGAIAGNGGTKTRRLVAPAPATRFELKIFGLVLIVAILLGMISNIVFILGSGIPLSDVLDVSKLVIVSNAIYVQRYDDVAPLQPPALSQALLPFIYMAPAIGGIVFELRKEKLWRLIGLFSFLPALAVTILQTTKAAVLFSMVLWLSGYFATRLRHGKLAVFTKGHFLAAAVIGLPLGIFFFAVGLARLASTDVSLLNVVLIKLVTSAFGHMTILSQWLADYWAEPFDPTLGQVTFAGPLEMLGISHRIPGLFDNFVNLVAGETSNIYTGFRPLIQDFTIPGAIAVLAMLGFVGGAGFRMVAAGKWSAVPLLLISYVTIFWTPITWFWVYNSLTATVLGVAVVVFFIRLWRGSRGRSISREGIGAT
jgi:oligosaccharide repeat unit polymerase